MAREVRVGPGGAERRDEEVERQQDARAREDREGRQRSSAGRAQDASSEVTTGAGRDCGAPRRVSARHAMRKVTLMPSIPR